MDESLRVDDDKRLSDMIAEMTGGATCADPAIYDRTVRGDEIGYLSVKTRRGNQAHSLASRMRCDPRGGGSHFTRMDYEGIGANLFTVSDGERRGVGATQLPSRACRRCDRRLRVASALLLLRVNDRQEKVQPLLTARARRPGVPDSASPFRGATDGPGVEMEGSVPSSGVTSRLR